MSHQVILNFDMDEMKIQEYAEKEAGRQIAKDLMDSTFGTSYSRSKAMREYVKDIIREMLEPEKEEIINEAVQRVTDNLHRTKAVREKLMEALEEK